MQDKYVKHTLNIFPSIVRNASEKTLSVSVEEPVVVFIHFSIRPMLCQILIICVNFKTSEDYLRELDCSQKKRQIDKQAECINSFQFFLESIKSLTGNAN